MKYIGWADVVWKRIWIKRLSNWKWYDWYVLLKQTKDYLEWADNWKVKDQFLAEHKEILKVFNFFWMKLSQALIYTPKKEEIL